MTKLPHLVIFNLDQWRGDVLGHMNNPGAVTPTLDRWVETDAVSFRQPYCQNPAELHNVIDEPAYADILIELKERMLTWYQETCDVVPRDADERS